MRQDSNPMVALALWLALALCCLTSAAALAESGAPATAVPTKATPPLASAAVCATIAEAAKAHALPPDYFARLIWRESRFHPRALSPAGAQGVAQFMPATAAEHGLGDPFAVEDALAHSAAFLDELRTTFGNLGLAAAAYNAGPGRVSRWLAGAVALPQETLDYVVAVTGHDADAWRAKPPPALRRDKDFDCARWALLASRTPDAPSAGGDPSAKPWAVILVGSPLRDRAMSAYRIVRGQYAGILGGVEPSVVHKRISGMVAPRYIVQIERDTRGAADALCSRLLRAGGNCFVLANRS